MHFRDPSKNDDPCPDYGPNSPFLTVCIHYGGNPANWAGAYIEGQLIKFDHLDITRYTFSEIRRLAAHLENSVDAQLFHRDDNEKVFREIGSEEDLRLIFEAARTCGEVNIYTLKFEGVSGAAAHTSQDVQVEEPIIDLEKQTDVDEGSVRKQARTSRRLAAKREAIKRGKKPVELVEEVDDDSECRDSDYELEEDAKFGQDDLDFEKHVDRNVEWIGCNIDEAVGDDVDELQIDGFGEEDVCGSEDELRSIHESDDDNPDRVHPTWRPDYSRSPNLQLGMVFSTKKEFRDMIDTHAILENRNVRFVKSDKRRIYAVCEDENCEFRVNALRRDGESSLIVTTCIPAHSCAPSHTVRNMKSRWLAERFGYVFQTDKKRKIGAFREDAIKEIRCDISPWQAFMCKQRTVKSLEGRADEQYKLLWDYAAELRRTNPGSTIILNVDQTAEGNKFSRFYVCLSALKEGMLGGCRPLFGLDGTFLKGPHGGIVLTAVGVDPNNNSFPFAYAVVSCENEENWCWFVGQLRKDLKIEKPWEWTVISDKQKGLIKAVEEELPGASHRFCVRHMHLNMRNSGFRGHQFKVAVWRAAKACTVAHLERRMDELKKMDVAAYNWLKAKPPHQWSRSHFDPYPRCDLLMNNMCESFNSKILNARELPILSMLERIMNVLMKRSTENRDMAQRWKGVLCPRIQQVLDFNTSKIPDCMPIKADDSHYQIACFDGNQYAVDLDNKTCACRKWDLTWIPCKHALTAIHRQGQDPRAFVDRCYRVATYMAAYGHTIFPINGRHEWAHVDAIPPLPPKAVRRVGRPPKARRREPDEPQVKHVARRGRPVNRDPHHRKRNQTTIKCGHCGVPGHNRRNCPFDDTRETEEERLRIQKILQDCGLEDLEEEGVIDEIFKDDDHHVDLEGQSGSQPTANESAVPVQEERDPVDLPNLEDQNAEIETQEGLISQLTQINEELGRMDVIDTIPAENESAALDDEPILEIQIWGGRNNTSRECSSLRNEANGGRLWFSRSSWRRIAKCLQTNVNQVVFWRDKLFLCNI